MPLYSGARRCVSPADEPRHGFPFESLAYGNDGAHDSIEKPGFEALRIFIYPLVKILVCNSGSQLHCR